MIDVGKLLINIDCREQIERDLGQPHHRNDKYAAWKCPLHSEQHGYSLVAWANGWKCFGSCSTSGDVIRWVMRYHNLDFRAAVALLGGQDDPNVSRRPAQKPCTPLPSMAEPPSKEWQAAAWRLAEHCEKALWSLDGQRALQYLCLRRRLFQDTVHQARLGYSDQWIDTGLKKSDGKPVFLAPGIVIPWIADGQIWALKVRSRVGDLARSLHIEPDTCKDGTEPAKYINLAGGNQPGALYWADHLCQARGKEVVVTEGEIDCLTVWQATDVTYPVTVGSAGYGINPRWYSLLAQARRIWLLFDTDQAGVKATARLGKLSARCLPLTVPDGFKDVNDYHCSKPTLSVKEWLEGTKVKEMA